MIINVTRTHYLKSCIIEGYEEYFCRWEIKAEGAWYGNILDFCQKYCDEERFTKDQFIKDLQFILAKSKGKYHIAFNLRFFYELYYDNDKQIWVYITRNIKEYFT